MLPNESCVLVLLVKQELEVIFSENKTILSA